MAKRPNPIDQTINEGETSPFDESTDAAPETEGARPVFKKFPESRIPVPKSMGSLWKSRFDQGKSKLDADGTHEAWDEAVRYYKNDQTNKRNRDDPDRPSLGPEKNIA